MVVYGAAWTMLAQWAGWAVSLIVLVVIAKILGPDAFGLVGLAGMVTAFGRVLVDNTLLESLVQRDRLEPGHVHTMFWFMAALGIVITGMIIALAAPAAAFFDTPAVSSLIIGLSPLLLLSALMAVPTALLQRRLRFRALALSTLLAGVIGGTIGICSALYGLGVWSMVAMHISNACVEAIMVWIVSGFFPERQFVWHYFRDLGRFNASIYIGRIIGFINYELPRFFAGILLGPVAVGYFSMSRKSIQLLSTMLVQPLDKVGFPTFSRLKADTPRFRRVYEAGLRLNSLATFPCFVGLALLAPLLVQAVLGAEWKAATIIIQILAISGLRQSSVTLNSIVFRATAYPHLHAMLIGAGTLVGAVLMLSLSGYGLVGLAGALVLRDFLMWPIGAVLISKFSGISLLHQLRPCASAALATAVMSLAVYAFLTMGSEGINVWVTIGLALLIGALTYLSVLFVVDRRSIRDARDVWIVLRENIPDVRSKARFAPVMRDFESERL